MNYLLTPDAEPLSPYRSFPEAWPGHWKKCQKRFPTQAQSSGDDSAWMIPDTLGRYHPCRALQRSVRLQCVIDFCNESRHIAINLENPNLWILMSAADTIASVHETSARSDAAYALSVDSPSIVSEVGESARTWRPMPGELVSLWDMLRFNAQTFFMLTSLLNRVEFSLENLKDQLFHGDNQASEQIQQILQGDDDDPNNVRIREIAQQVWEKTYSDWKSILNGLEGHCHQLSLTSVIGQIERIRQEIEQNKQLRCFEKWVEFRNSFRSLSQRIEDELEYRLFIFITPGQAKLYEEEHPFGTEISNKFLDLVEDITEASKCLGFNRFTAAVFHLMRALEVVVQKFANRLNAAINLEQPWGDILKPIDDEIAKLPGGRNATTAEKEWKAKCSEIAAFLRHVKDGWRNTTMHPKRTYTEEEAKSIFEAVKVFVQSFAKL